MTSNFIYKNDPGKGIHKIATLIIFPHAELKHNQVLHILFDWDNDEIIIDGKQFFNGKNLFSALFRTFLPIALISQHPDYFSLPYLTNGLQSTNQAPEWPLTETLFYSEEKIVILNDPFNIFPEEKQIGLFIVYPNFEAAHLVDISSERSVKGKTLSFNGDPLLGGYLSFSMSSVPCSPIFKDERDLQERWLIETLKQAGFADTLNKFIEKSKKL